jgi:hypothetical protein
LLTTQPSEDARWRVWVRRLVVGSVLAAQAALLVRGTWSDHKELAWRMFPEASEWRADLWLVGEDGRRSPIDDAAWGRLVRGRGLDRPSVRHHADAGIANQLAFLRSAVRWYATHDDADGVVEADVTYWRNVRGPRHVVYRSER